MRSFASLIYSRVLITHMAKCGELIFSPKLMSQADVLLPSGMSQKENVAKSVISHMNL